ncbi:helix-turn-helix domain-containing protein [Streptomyces sp. NPDC001339]|uniref:helix-turn-helix domain-containing protein n=1 Tax=Streptomyces sp. NPDC001339 TaxID=3364563 RepID=UPI0036A02942
MAKGSGKRGFGQDKTGWGFFGSELKRRREAAKLTQQQLGERVICSGSYIGQLEAAIRKPQLDMAERLDAELTTDGLFARMCEELINNSPHADYFTEAAHLEGLAVTIREYAPMFVPGLLQTPAYARAVVLAAQPLAPEEEVERLVTARCERARILDHPTDPLLWAVLDESVIRRKVGGAAVMREQLQHIVDLVRRRRIVIQVLPLDAVPALTGMLNLMTFEEGPPVAYIEAPKTGNLLDDPARVTQCELRYDLVRATALSPEASLALIESVAEEYAHEG